jgi:hypothetical protein
LRFQIISNERLLSESPGLKTLVLAALLVFGSEAAVQVTSVIQGHISGRSGASVPNVTVKVTNERTGVSRTAYTANFMARAAAATNRTFAVSSRT